MTRQELEAAGFRYLGKLQLPAVPGPTWEWKEALELRLDPPVQLCNGDRISIRVAWENGGLVVELAAATQLDALDDVPTDRIEVERR